MNQVDIFDERACELGEGPFYDARTGRVGWVDILAARVLWRGLSGGETGEISCPAPVGAAIPRVDGGLVLCLPDGPVLREPDGRLRPLGGYADADRAAGRPANDTPVRSNDAKTDPAGRLWLGTAVDGPGSGTGALYRLDPGADAVERVVDDVMVSNGLGWSPDGGIMYYVDTGYPKIDMFDYDVATGTIDGRRTFVEIPAADGAPDGLCVDADGGVWVALWGGGAVRRYGPDGRLDRVLEVPAKRATSCAFAGEQRDLLIITTAADEHVESDAAGRTYRHTPPDGITGLPVPPYAG